MLFRPTGPVRAHAEMTTAAARAVPTGDRLLDRVRHRARRSWRWRPLVLPPFWQRFVTEILIWGLLAMSSDILIGYTGMVSFGHSAFFGLGMYGAAAALLTVQAAESRAGASLTGLVGAGRRRGLRRLLRDAAPRDLLLHLDPRLLADLLRHHLHLDRRDRRRERPLLQPARPRDPGLRADLASRSATFHWFVLAVVALSYLVARRIMLSPFGMVLQSIRENEARTRAIGYHVERYKMVAVHAVGAVRRPGRRALRRPEQVRRPRLRPLRRVRRGRDLQRDGRDRAPWWARSPGPRSSCCCGRASPGSSRSTT